jgi:hypothetical protein
MSQQPTTRKSTKSSTSKSSGTGRSKSKKTTKAKAFDPLKGNDNFNERLVADVQEALADDPEAQRLAKEQDALIKAVLAADPVGAQKPTPAPVPVGLSANEVVPDFDLGDVSLDIPAKTINEFQDHIAVAKANGIKELFATAGILKHYLRSGYEKSPGYFVYHGIKVYEEGKVADAKAHDAITMEQRNFGASLAKIEDIPSPKGQ